MVCSRWFSLSLVWCLNAMTALAQFDVSDIDTFNRAARWRATIIDNHLFIDGGEVSQEGHNSRDRASNKINSTLSLDCSTSWSRDTVEIQEISRPDDIPVFSEQTILTERSSGRFYIFGGYSLYVSAEQDALWRFTPGSDGDGGWSSQTPADPDMFQNMRRTHSSASVSVGDAGFIFGGKITDSSGRHTHENAIGFMSYNFTTREWIENSRKDDTPYSQDGSLWGAEAVYVEQFGLEGLIFILGGVMRHLDSAQGYIDWRTLWFYDIASQTWYSQETMGDDAPSDRSHHCAVGVAGNDTYEIFVYGGYNDYSDEGRGSGEIYVLSLPGFKWTRIQDDDNFRRKNHVCVLAGESQLISLGGFDRTGDDPRDEWSAKDSFPRGIGIFDMNSFEWKDTFEPDQEYHTHESIRAWYDDGGLENMDWSSEVKALFIPDSGEKDPDDGPGENTPEPEPRSTTPIGAIVGGTVGGVAGLGIIFALVWLLKRRKAQQAKSEGLASASRPDLGIYESKQTSPFTNAVVPPSSHTPSAPSELSTRWLSELPNNERSELSGVENHRL